MIGAVGPRFAIRDNFAIRADRLPSGVYDGPLLSILIEAHGLTNGDGPFRVSSSGSLPAGLAAGTDYYAVRRHTDYIALATSMNDAIDGVVVTLTSTGSGTHTIADTASTLDVDVFEYVDTAIEAVSNALDKLTITAHGLLTGDGPVRIVVEGGGAIPGGLAEATDYWIVNTGVNDFKLATSAANALAFTTINITSDGTLPLTLAATAYTAHNAALVYADATFVAEEMVL